MVMIVIMTLSILWIYGLISSWRNLTHIVEDKQSALNYAREAIEAVQNIRDTNWSKYILDARDQCWFSRYYDINCSLNDYNPSLPTTWNLYPDWLYIVWLGKYFQNMDTVSQKYWNTFSSVPSFVFDVSDNHFYLVGNKSGGAVFDDAADEDFFWIYLDSSGHPYQRNTPSNTTVSGDELCTKTKVADCQTRFRRIIQIEYPQQEPSNSLENDFGISACTSDWEDGDLHQRKHCLRVTVTVQWQDNYSGGSHEVVLEQIITNWN